jgi:CotH kinase protein
MEEQCSLNVVYPGSCECANFCFEHATSAARGSCAVNGQTSRKYCHCKERFQGSDCSMVSCPAAANSGQVGDVCNGHGRCDAQLRSCRCDDGWTLNDCSAPMFSGRSPALAAYGQVFGGECAYCGTDAHGDTHPIFSVAEVAQVKVNVAEHLLRDVLLNVSNIYSGQYVAADSMHFYSGAAGVVETSSAMSLRVKGAYSQHALKKSWLIKTHHLSTQAGAAFPKRLGLKADWRAFLSQFIAELYRAWPLPVGRGGYAQLWINDVSMGYFWLEEHVDAQFLKSRFARPDGTLFNMRYHSFLETLGDGSPDAYVYSSYRLAQADRAGDERDAWSQLADFIRFANAASDAEFEQRIESLFDVESFLRQAVIAFYFNDVDGYCATGNNAYLYFEPDGVARMIRHDFDAQATSRTRRPLSLFCNAHSVLCVRIIDHTPRFQQRFYTLLELFINRVLSQPAIFERLSEFGTFLAFQTDASDPGSAFIRGQSEQTSPFSPAYARSMQTDLRQRNAYLRRQIALNKHS